MADLMQGVSEYATGTLDTATVLVNNVSPMNAAQPNGLADAIIQMQNVLGVGPDLKGILADLATRLARQIQPSGIIMPIGIGIPFFGPSLPAGRWVWADGGAISRTGIYSELFAEIGTTYGPGDGVNTFNKPDARGRTFIGVGTGAGGGISGTGLITGGVALDAVSLGSWRGTMHHILTGRESGIQQHNHGVTDPGHAHTLSDFSIGGAGASWQPSGINDNTTVVKWTSSTNTTGLTINNVSHTSALDALDLMQPVIACNVIIPY